MNKLLNVLSLVLTICFVFTSCKDDSSYPASINGLWGVDNGSTNASCDVEFATDGSSGQTCKITIVSADQKTVDTFEGGFTYDPSNGTAEFKSDLDGAPTAKFQVNESGTELSATIESTTTNYGSYTLQKISYPKNIAGTWTGEGRSNMSIVAKFQSYAKNGKIPMYFVLNSVQTFPGTYTYNNATGVATVTLADEPDEPIELKYNINTNTLEGENAKMGLKISMKRVVTDNTDK